MLTSGYKLVNGGASCAVGWQGSVGCEAGEHGFTQYAYQGFNH